MNDYIIDLLKQLILGIAVILFAIFGLTYLVPHGISVPRSITSEYLSPRFWPTIILYCLLGLEIFTSIKHILLLRGQQIKLSNFFPKESKIIFFKFMLSLLFMFLAFWDVEITGLPLSVTFFMFALYFLAEQKLHLLPSLIMLVAPWILYFFFTYVANIMIPLGFMEWS